jgi:hypothetical protein
MSATALSTDFVAIDDMTQLQQLSFAQLKELYQQSSCPDALSDLNGDAKGQMLAWRVPASGPLAWLLRKMGGAESFPWEGKSFEASSATEGSGINRIELFGRRRWFPFGTRFDASIIDGRPAFVLDYAVRKNLPLIRSIVDEVREVAPGLYFGPAALKIGGRPRLILFFALSYQPQN